MKSLNSNHAAWKALNDLSVRWLAFALALLPCAMAMAQETPDARAFKAAVQDYQIGVYDRAERGFAQFIASFPESPMLPEAFLLQARAAIYQTNLATAITLLSSNLVKSGPLADQYRYRIGEAQFLKGDYPAAAQSFASLTKEITNSVLLLEASHGEALARFRLGDYPRVVALLQQTNEVFQTAARSRSADELTLRGQLLLGEALFAQNRLQEAEEVVRRAPEQALTPDLTWDRQHLLCRILVAGRRPVEALVATTNLVAMAAATTRPHLVADSVELHGQLLEQLNLLEAALTVYTNNLAGTVPAERQRLALLRIIHIKLAQDKTTEASRMIEAFLESHPGDTAADLALLTLGELQLKQHRAAAAADGVAGASGTNYLQQALAQFDRLLATQTNSPLRGRAFLDKGWCLWSDGKFPESAVAFKAAAELLPWSEDLAVTRFKLGDAQFALRDFTNAIASYRAVTNDFASMPRARETLFDQALFQMTRAQLEMGDLAAAGETLRTLLDWFPESSFCDRGLLLVGQGCLEARQNARARALFAELVRRAPESPLRPRAELAAARSHAQDGDLRAAIAGYNDWITRLPTNALRAQAEFDRAGAHWRAGDDTNAFSLLTNFVALFSTHELAPLAQYWVGDYFMRMGDPVNAQKKFQNIIENTNWPVTRLKYQARLAAGRAAYARQAWNEAAGERGHFTVLINDVQNCPPDIAAEALFAFADTRTREEARPSQPLDKFDEARTIFTKIIPFATNEVASRLVPLAWGRIGDCSLQLAGADPKQYEAATNAYWRVITNRLAALPTRSLAEFGLAKTLEAMAGGAADAESGGLRNAAFDHYYNVALGANAAEGEEPDPYWTKEAGFAAARMAEEQRRWTVALNLYKRLSDLLPLLRPRLQEKMERVREQMQREKN